MLTRLLLIPTLFLALAGHCFAAVPDVSKLRPLPVLDGGRVKPFDTVARETARLVTGHENFGEVADDGGGQSIRNPLDPVALAVDWAVNRVQWESRPVLYVPLLELRRKLGMPESHQWVAPRDLRGNNEFRTWVAQLAQTKADAEQNQEQAKFGRLEDAALELSDRLDRFDGAASLSIYPVLPVPNAPDHWITLASILSVQPGEGGDAVAPVKAAWVGVADGWSKGDQKSFSTNAHNLWESIRALAGTDYAGRAAMGREVFYNTFKPFRVTWALYLAAVAALVAATMIRSLWVYWGAVGLFAGAIGFNIFAFAVRCSITGWAPVTNMYESVIWVAIAAAAFALAMELVYRQRVAALGGAVVALLAGLVADVMPPEYGGAVRTLAPVLRSNFWLSIHVLTIVSSYAAFALALVLGNLVLGQYLLGKENTEAARTNLKFTYRSIQIGVLLVAAGTILGGLWADVSWGRFWGWDPKEVWALIVLLTYLALLHGRYAGWVKSFGLAAGATVCFTAVVMSWYGVNFVLGVGLHSYGFNTGGQGYVAAFVLAQWAFVAIAWIAHRARTPRARRDGAKSELQSGTEGAALPSV